MIEPSQTKKINHISKKITNYNFYVMENKKKSIILISSFSLVFILGIFLLYPFNQITIDESDIYSLIHVDDLSSLNEIKNNLNLFLWNQKDIPDYLPIVENNIIDNRYTHLQNLDSIDKFSINMEYEINSIAYLFKPINDNGELVIYHQGHRGDFIEGVDTIQFFLEKNYSVVAFSMPLTGMNHQPTIDSPEFGKVKLESHNQMELIEDNNLKPIKFFVEPIIVTLNYIEINYNFDFTHMVGISGGGWTTVLAAAIDDRINKSFSVAGSYPMFLRIDQKNFGDYEQHHLELYEKASYLDLYVMSSIGSDRKFVQIFNKFDPCCFDGDSFSLYEQQVKEAVTNLGDGYFEIYLDDTHNEHIISNHTLEIIINEMTR